MKHIALATNDIFATSRALALSAFKPREMPKIIMLTLLHVLI